MVENLASVCFESFSRAHKYYQGLIDSISPLYMYYTNRVLLLAMLIDHNYYLAFCMTHLVYVDKGRNAAYAGAICRAFYCLLLEARCCATAAATALRS